MTASKLDTAIPPQTAQKIYDALGKRYDWFGSFDARAKAQALQRLGLEAGQKVLEVGTGTGKEHALIQAAVAPGGTCFGVDLSRVMLGLTQKRSQTPLCQADARLLPLASGRFDRVYSAFVLDLLPSAGLPGLLAGFWRVLKPGGRLVLAGLTEGCDLPSRALVAVWKAAYTLSPASCAGCRPLRLFELVQRAGFQKVERQVVVQMAVPSEILCAEK